MYKCNSCNLITSELFKTCPCCRRESKMDVVEDKIIITLDGGLVQQVFSTRTGTQVMIIDMDTDGADPDEFISVEEIEKFKNNNKFHETGIKSGICEADSFNI